MKTAALFISMVVLILWAFLPANETLASSYFANLKAGASVPEDCSFSGCNNNLDKCITTPNEENCEIKYKYNSKDGVVKADCYDEPCGTGTIHVYTTNCDDETCTLNPNTHTYSCNPAQVNNRCSVDNYSQTLSNGTTIYYANCTENPCKEIVPE